ncbi:MAG: hypothetical protein GXY54_03210 [Deltaproteobacteria bacterium]|mgnify:CR=1 FL=1|nr:hypothetical protein [Deltaproteobacteria bacterium]
MKKKVLSVGDRVDARCTKCRKVLNHTIIAMVEERPARVLCNTCGGEHNYKDPSPVTRTKTSTPGSKKVSKAKADINKAERQYWENIQSDMDSSKAVNYAMDGHFNVGVLLSHPVFGLGLVQETIGVNKIRVLFQEGQKLLRCATAGPDRK